VKDTPAGRQGQGRMNADRFVLRVATGSEVPQDLLNLDPNQLQHVWIFDGSLTLQGAADRLGVDAAGLGRQLLPLIEKGYLALSGSDELEVFTQYLAEAGDEEDLTAGAEAIAKGLDEIDGLTDKVQEQVIPATETWNIETGNWDQESAIDLLTRLHQDKATGRLRLFANNGEYKSLYFYRGNLANVISHPFEPGECLGRILQMAGRLRKEDIIVTLKKRQETGMLQGEQLVKMGKLRPHLLDEVLRFQMELKVGPIFSWPSGHYQFLELATLPDWIARVDIPFERIFFNLLLRNYSMEKGVDSITKRAKQNLWVGKALNPPFDPHLFGFGKKLEKFWGQILEKDNEIKRVMIVSHLKGPQTKLMLWLLYRMGMLEFLQDTREDRLQAKLDAINERLKYIDRETYFQLLSVHWSANDHQVKTAWEKLKDEIELKMAGASEAENILLKEVLRYSKLAYEGIRTRERREEYRYKVYDETFIEFNAEIFRQKGESYLFTKDEYDQAVLEMESAVEVYNKDPEFFIVLGLSRFFHGYPHDRGLMNSGRSLLNQYYTLIPNNVLANLCMGMMYRREMHQNKAKHYYGKVLELDSDNRFAKIELREIETGTTAADRESVVKEFLNRRNAGDDKLDQIMKKKKRNA
jgi:tetratricopeptide (TPR) repeat protein